jgi:hypothetical protein
MGRCEGVAHGDIRVVSSWLDLQMFAQRRVRFVENATFGGPVPDDQQLVRHANFYANIEKGSIMVMAMRPVDDHAAKYNSIEETPKLGRLFGHALR